MREVMAVLGGGLNLVFKFAIASALNTLIQEAALTDGVARTLE